MIKGFLFAGALFVAGQAFAEEKTDKTESLYDVSMEAQPTSLKPGAKAKLLLRIQPKPGAHISTEAPLKVELQGEGLSLSKAALSQKDSVGVKAAGEAFAAPRFEVPFTAVAAGRASVSAKLTFFVCTESLCNRQQRTLKTDVSVVP
jgi:hypothetical protein